VANRAEQRRGFRRTVGRDLAPAEIERHLGQDEQGALGSGTVAGSRGADEHVAHSFHCCGSRSGTNRAVDGRDVGNHAEFAPCPFPGIGAGIRRLATPGPRLGSADRRAVATGHAARDRSTGELLPRFLDTDTVSGSGRDRNMRRAGEMRQSAARP